MFLKQVWVLLSAVVAMQASVVRLLFMPARWMQWLIVKTILVQPSVVVKITVKADR